MLCFEQYWYAPTLINTFYNSKKGESRFAPIGPKFEPRTQSCRSMAPRPDNAQLISCSAQSSLFVKVWAEVIGDPLEISTENHP